jgi:hypothetical protein
MKALFFASAMLLAASACGSASRVSQEAPEGDRDAAGDAAASDAPRAEPDGASDFVAPRCGGASYVTAPSGAACVPERIEHAKGLEGICLGPAVGAACDRFEVSVSPGEQTGVPPGFACGAEESGVVTCRWTFGDASFGTLDDAALEAACAATVNAPSARVRCLVFGS